MPSSITTSEKKRKSALQKKSTKSFEPSNNKHKAAKSSIPIQDSDEYTDDDDEEEEEEEVMTKKGNIQDIANKATKEMQGKLKQAVDSDSEEETVDGDAMTTMNAIIEYNKMLVQRLEKLEADTGRLKKSDVQGTVKDTMNDVSAKYNKKEESTGTQHSFELPIGRDMMQGYGCFSTEPISDDKDDSKKSDDGEATIKDGGDTIVREKDDIVVKVEATKTGITFSIHIPRS